MSQRPYKTISVTPRHCGSAVVECVHCQTMQTVELDEDGQPCFETQPCACDICTQRLCPSCPRFACEGCGLAHCEEHAIVLSGEKWCPVCVTAMVAEGELELAPEMCPRCRKVPAVRLCADCSEETAREDRESGRDAYSVGAERCPERD